MIERRLRSSMPLSVDDSGEDMDLYRRNVLRNGVVLMVAGGFAPLVRADSPPMLSQSDPLAQALGYESDARKVDKSKYPQYVAGQMCSSCSLYRGTPGAAYGPCPIYGGKDVAASGWCSSYAKKP